MLSNQTYSCKKLKKECFYPSDIIIYTKSMNNIASTTNTEFNNATCDSMILSSLYLMTENGMIR